MEMITVESSYEEKRAEDEMLGNGYFVDQEEATFFVSTVDPKYAIETPVKRRTGLVKEVSVHGNNGTRSPVLTVCYKGLHGATNGIFELSTSAGLVVATLGIGKIEALANTTCELHFRRTGDYSEQGQACVFRLQAKRKENIH